MKLYSARAAMEVALEAVQVYGGNGYMAEYQVEQLCAGREGAADLRRHGRDPDLRDRARPAVTLVVRGSSRRNAGARSVDRLVLRTRAQALQDTDQAILVRA